MAEAHPVGLPVGDGGQAPGRDGHPRRPALHPHLGGGRPPRADPGRLRHRVPRRAGQPRAEQRPRLPRVRRGLHQRRRDHRRGLPGHRGPRRAVLRLRPGDRALRPDHAGSTTARPRRPRPASATRRRPPGGRAPAATSDAEQSHEAARSESHGSGGPPVELQGPRATRPCRTRAASSRSSSGTSPATPRRWSRRSAASRPEQFAKVADALTSNSGRERTSRALLRRGLDPPQRRRADDPHRGDPADAARQHRPARRRDHGAARAREHPGLDRHPDAVQHPARLPADAACAPAPVDLDEYVAADDGQGRASGATCAPTP